MYEDAWQWDPIGYKRDSLPYLPTLLLLYRWFPNKQRIEF
jgi:hypothetical protein